MGGKVNFLPVVSGGAQRVDEVPDFWAIQGRLGRAYIISEMFGKAGGAEIILACKADMNQHAAIIHFP